jgi:hypothetical protein
MSFQPLDIRLYDFFIPIELVGVGPIPEILRKIVAEGTKPRFLVDPISLDFKKKYLVNLDNNAALKSMSNADLFTIRDEILANVNQFIYLLTFK